MVGFLLLVLAAVSWGTTGTTMKLVAAGSSMSPVLVGLVRMAIAAPCLWLAARTLAGPIRLPRRKHAPRLLLAGLAMGAYQVCYFGGVAKTSVAVGSLIAICSAPLLITILAAAWLGERTDRVTWAALAAGVTGAALLTLGPHGAGRLPPGFAGGVALALGAGLAYAVYTVLAKDLVERLPPLTVAALTFAVAAVVLAPALLRERPVASAASWALLLYLGLVPTTLAYVLYMTGLRRTRVSVAAVIGLLEPLTATVLGVTLFGERLGATGAAGAVLLLSAVAALALRR